MTNTGSASPEMLAFATAALAIAEDLFVLTTADRLEFAEAIAARNAADCEAWALLVVYDVAEHPAAEELVRLGRAAGTRGIGA